MILRLLMKINISRNNIPLAIMIVENEFRPFIVRLIEYLYLFICLRFNREKALNISIGVAQVKYKYWLEYYTGTDNYSSFYNIFFFEDPIKNYDLVEWYLNQRKFRNSIEISEIYTGAKNIYYANKIDKAMITIINIQRLGRHLKSGDIS
ncbi:hypothetical protein [Paenibacillus soyae]|uniref:Uncharacterized protein n=1 Tax=Paenibacillus soyae TaxID=2969249 RepID=A0A9X2MYP8_9BACL|nr:hypothetical protein [Paenibacillus soyae]MCR2805947.1 hypothetical protein [Paenibacillus soyae]